MYFLDSTKKAMNMKKNKLIFTTTLILLLTTLVYVLGFASNVSYGNLEITYSTDLAKFNEVIQKFNSNMYKFLIGLFIVLVGCYVTNSHNRTRYYLSNVISVSLMSASLAVFAIVNVIPLPGYIKTYTQILIDNPEEIERMKRISSLIDTNFFYYFGIVLSVLMLALAVYLVVYLVLKMKNQKAYLQQRDEVLSNAV